jgi:hypothetical protein
MGTEMDIDQLEAEFREVRDEMKEILFEIRIFLMGALTPIPNDLIKEQLRAKLEAERR